MNGRMKMSKYLHTLSDLVLYTLVGACFVLGLSWAGATFAQSRLSVINVVVEKATATPRLSFAQPALTLTLGETAANPARSDQPASKGAITYRSSDDAIARVAADGTVTAVAAGTATVTATQAADLPAFESGSGSYQVTVVGPLSAKATLAAGTWLVGEPFADMVPVTASGGIGKLSYAIAPTVPAGLAFSTDTGVLSGTATVDSPETTYTVTVSDAATPAHTASATFDMTIGPAFVATGGGDRIGFMLNEYNMVEGLLQVRGGIGAFHAAVSPPLPPGVSVSVAKDRTDAGLYLVNIDGSGTVASPWTTYTVTVTDSAVIAHSYTANFSFAVADVLTATVVDGNKIATVGESINYRPVTGSGGLPEVSAFAYAYAVSPALPAGLAMDGATGVITGSASSAAPATSYTVALSVDGLVSAVPPVTANFTLEIVDGLAATTVISTQTIVVGDPALDITPVTAIGGVGTRHFAVAPTLPAGLSMSAATGVITGAASGESKEAVYTVTVTDDAGHKAAATFSLAVNAGLKTSVFNHGEEHRVTDPVDYTPPMTSGGVRPYQYTVTPALPTGLAMNAGTGAITGAATAPSAITTYTYTVTDSATPAHSATGTFTLAIAPALTATAVGTTTISVEVGKPVTESPVKAEGGLGLPQFSVQPALPSGLGMDARSGEITGTATAPSPETEYTVTVTDGASPPQTASATFKLSVSSNPGIAITMNAPVKPQRISMVFPPYAPVTASSGIGSALTYTVAPALPSGLSMDPATGIISGTPTVEQVDSSDARYTVTVTDSASPAHEAEARFGLVTYQLPTATVLVSSKTYQAGEAVNYQPVSGVSAAGRPVTYRVAGGGLPRGLKMDPSTGVITGTTHEKMKSEFFVYVSDLPLDGVLFASALFILEIVPPAAP
ncbi:Putative Ig domain [Achromobacter sp. 2789STDY5608621]|nr:Putative Ig domain [Achromobacter sp. 2789STDY5608621]